MGTKKSVMPKSELDLENMVLKKLGQCFLNLENQARTFSRLTNAIQINLLILYILVPFVFSVSSTFVFHRSQVLLWGSYFEPPNRQRYSSHDSSTTFCSQVTRTEELVSQSTIQNQVLLSYLQGNVWHSEGRITSWILGVKGLKNILRLQV